MFSNGSRQQTYIGNTLTIDDIGHGRKVTEMAVGKERVDSSYLIKPVKTSNKVGDISQVKLPKGSVAVGEIDLGHKLIIEEPHEVVKYVEKEVPYEEIVYQPKVTREYVTKEVPDYYDEEVDEIVEVEEIEYQDVVKEEFVDKIIYIEKPVPSTVERKIPVTLTIPKIVEKEVEKVVEVPSGEIIHKEVKVVKEKVNYKRRFVEKHVPIVVGHEIHPVVCLDRNIVREVEVTDHYPVLTPVDVHIAKPVNINVRADGAGQVTHRVVTVPAAHYNTLLKKLNPTLHEDLPLFMENGVIPLLNQELSFLYPPADAEIIGFNAFEPAYEGVEEKHYITASKSGDISSSDEVAHQRSAQLSHATKNTKKSHSAMSHGTKSHHTQQMITTRSVSQSKFDSSYRSVSDATVKVHAVNTATNDKKKVCGVC